MRADKFFSDKFGSRTKAKEELEKGRILRNGKPLKAKDEVSSEDEFTFIEAKERFVSNGGYKLSKALQDFSESVEGLVCADIGASTGGFTDCLLQNAAKKVYAVDVGESLLDISLQEDKRIVRLENINARYLKKADFLEEIECITADVSFISLKYILPSISDILSSEGKAFVLIKPQFECDNKNIGKSGIVHPSAHKKIVEKVLKYVKDSSLFPQKITNAPIKKGKNIEYVILLKKKFCISDKEILNEVERIVSFNSQNKHKENE